MLDIGNTVIGYFQPTTGFAFLLCPIWIERHAYHVVFTSIGLKNVEHAVVYPLVVSRVQVDNDFGVGTYSFHGIISHIVECSQLFGIINRPHRKHHAGSCFITYLYPFRCNPNRF